MTLNDRAYYLAQALTSAKSAASLGADDVEFMSGLQERIDVTQVQMEVARAVDAHPDLGHEEQQQLLASLNSDLLGLDEVCRLTWQDWLVFMFSPSAVSDLCSPLPVVRIHPSHSQDRGYKDRGCLRGSLATTVTSKVGRRSC